MRQLDWQGEVGCAFPAIVKHGVTLDAANVDASWIEEATRTPLLTGATGCPVTVINDADTAGVAEFVGAPGRVATDSVMVTLGTGIGTALFHRRGAGARLRASATW